MLDAMRLVPGRRSAIEQFVEAKRREAGKAAESRRWDGAWRMTRDAVGISASLRERSCEHGPRADLTAGPHIAHGRPVGHGAPSRRPTSAAAAYPSSVRVLRLGSSRVLDYGGRLVGVDVATGAYGMEG